jgi:hypothetical protein
MIATRMQTCKNKKEKRSNKQPLYMSKNNKQKFSPVLRRAPLVASKEAARFSHTPDLVIAANTNVPPPSKDAHCCIYCLFVCLVVCLLSCWVHVTHRSGAWQVASMAYAQSNVLSLAGIFMKSPLTKSTPFTAYRRAR